MGVVLTGVGIFMGSLMDSPEKQIEILSSGAVDFVSKKELLDKLREGRPLTIKAGFDPSRPNIHLGHLLLIGKLREFQDLGHRVVFVVGDWTACIGDPSGQNKTRPPIKREDVKKNAKTYREQAVRQTAPSSLDGADEKTRTLLHRFRRLDPDKTEFVFNSKWLEGLSLGEFVSRIVSHITLARILERDDFSKRQKDHGSIAFQELLYPILQAYDSVELKADVEIGGTDQLFNLLLGRELQKDFKQSPQCVLTLPLLEGLDGVEKMSQSLGNTLSFQDSAENIYGKVMNLSDKQMIQYWEKLGGADEGYRRSVETKRLHPMKEKELLAESLTRVFYGDTAAKRSKTGFQKLYSEKRTDDIPEHTVLERASLPLYELLVEELSLCHSNSSARRLIKAGAVRWDDKKIEDPDEQVDLIESDKPFVLKIGRQSFEVRIRPIEEKIVEHRDEPKPPAVGSRNTVPPSREFYLPVLKAVKGGCSTIQKVEKDVVAFFDLSKEAVEELTWMGNQRKVSDRMRWALFHLSKAKLIKGDKQKGFSITKEGKNILDQVSREGIKDIDQKFLRENCPAFREWEKSAYSPKDSLKDKHRDEPKPPAVRNTVPSSRKFYLPVLQFISNGKSSVQDVEEAVIGRFNLSKEAVEELTQMGNRSKVSDRMRWALFHLLKAELVEGDGRFSITKKGEGILKEISGKGIPVIDQKFLRENCPAFREWEKSAYSPKDSLKDKHRDEPKPPAVRNTVPSSRKFYLPVLQFISNGKSSVQDVEEAVIGRFNLSKEAVEELTWMGNQRKVSDRMRWALFHLSKAKLIEGDSYKGFSITKEGKNILDRVSREGIKDIDQKFLRENCLAFCKWEDRPYSKDYLKYKPKPPVVGSGNKVPPSREFYLPVLKAVKGGCSTIQKVEKDVVAFFDLSKEAVEELTQMGNRSKVSDRMRWALFHLLKAELVEGDGRFSITKKGEGILKEISGKGIPVIDQKFLRENCPAFREWENSAYSSDVYLQGLQSIGGKLKTS